MKIYSHSIVSNSDMIKNYKTCRQMADEQGRIFILKNNQLDAVLFSISEYERVAHLLEFVEKMSKKEIEHMTSILQLKDEGNKQPLVPVHSADA